MTDKTTPKVRLSKLLKATLIADGFDPEDFAQYFGEWKVLGQAGEYADPYFGKDGFYDRPRRNNRRVLRHVHLPPASDPAALAEWDRLHALGRKKTSDAALIYAFDPTHGYLLMHIVREPHGHALSEMTTMETRRLMNQFSDIAEEFIYFGAVNL